MFKFMFMFAFMLIYVLAKTRVMYAKKPEYLHCPPNILELNYKWRADY